MDFQVPRPGSRVGKIRNVVLVFGAAFLLTASAVSRRRGGQCVTEPE